MRSLPAETVYLPFESGPYRMAMGLTTIPESAWFEQDSCYLGEMAERRRLLALRHSDVFAALPTSDAARTEALQEITHSLITHRPDWFEHTGELLHNRLTDESWNLTALTCDPLEIIGQLVQEDVCIIQYDETSPVLTAAVLCFPSRWKLAEKIGRPLAQVHDAVPLYAERLARPVDRFMRLVKPHHIAARLNWSVVDDPALFQPTGKWREDHNPAVTAANAGETLFLRVERQTLRRLPRSEAILFGIRVHVYALAIAITCGAAAARLAAAIRALPAETMRYKSLRPVREALLSWLDARSP